jgi:hypothetical protein
MTIRSTGNRLDAFRDRSAGCDDPGAIGKREINPAAAGKYQQSAIRSSGIAGSWPTSRE